MKILRSFCIHSRLFTVGFTGSPVHFLIDFRSKIEESLDILEDPIRAGTMGITDSQRLSNSQRLRLCVYLIEFPYNFTGDGVWPNVAPQDDDIFDRRMQSMKKMPNEEDFD